MSDAAGESRAEVSTSLARREALAAHTETVAAHRLDQAKAAHRGYFRWRRLSRVAIVAFGVFAVVFLLWALPWLPRGLNTDDYTPQLALSVYLMAGVAAAAVFALAFQELARRDRESLMMWGTLFDEVSGLHNRTYLYDRLSLECEKAARNGGVFSVIALQIRLGGSVPGSSPALPASALQDIGTLVDCLTHPSDLVALLGSAELARNWRNKFKRSLN